MVEQSRKEQIIAVEKVLQEMKYAEDFLNSMNLSWIKRYFKTKSKDLDNLNTMDLSLMQKKYDNNYNLEDIYDNYEYYIPLKKVTLINDYSDVENDFEFGKVCWDSINTKKSSRKIYFENNGDIELVKVSPDGISYDMHYNVLMNDFLIKMNKDKMNLLYSLEGNKLYIKNNNIDIIENIETKEKIVSILDATKKIGKYNISTELFLILDANYNIRNAKVICIYINEKDDNLKTYTFIVDTNNIKATYESNNEEEIDITKQPRLLNMVINLITGGNDIDDYDSKIIKEFLNEFLKFANRSSKNIEYKGNIIKELEEEIINTIKNIEGKLPLKGIKERIDNSFKEIDYKTKKLRRK